MTERSPRAPGLGRLCTTVVRTTRTSSMSGQHSHSPHESGRSQRLACGARWYSRQYRRACSALPGHRRVTSRRASTVRPRGDKPGSSETRPGPVLCCACRARISAWTSVRDLRGIVPGGAQHAVSQACGGSDGKSFRIGRAGLIPPLTSTRASGRPSLCVSFMRWAKPARFAAMRRGSAARSC